MEAYMLIAILTLVDGTVLPATPIQMYETKQICIAQTNPPEGYKHIDKISTDWEVYKLEQAETRDVDTVGLTCYGPIEIPHPEWEGS